MTIALVCGVTMMLTAQPTSPFATKPKEAYKIGGSASNSSSSNSSGADNGDYQAEPSGSPIGTATALLLTLGAGYTGVKVYSKRKKETKDNQDL